MSCQGNVMPTCLNEKVIVAWVCCFFPNQITYSLNNNDQLLRLFGVEIPLFCLSLGSCGEFDHGTPRILKRKVRGFCFHEILGTLKYFPVNTKHLYNMCTISAQCRRRWADVVQLLHTCVVLARVLGMLHPWSWKYLSWTTVAISGGSYRFFMWNGLQQIYKAKVKWRLTWNKSSHRSLPLHYTKAKTISSITDDLKNKELQCCLQETSTTTNYAIFVSPT